MEAGLTQQGLLLSNGPFLAASDCQQVQVTECPRKTVLRHQHLDKKYAPSFPKRLPSPLEDLKRLLIPPVMQYPG